MNKIIFSLLVLAPTGLFAQQNDFTLNGVWKTGLNGQHVYLAYAKDGKTNLDSAAITDGKYTFRGQTTAGGTFASMFDKNPMTMAGRVGARRLSLFVEPVSFTVTHVDSFTNIRTSGSPMNAEYAKLKKQIDPALIQIQGLSNQYREARMTQDTARAGRIEREANTLQAGLQDQYADYVKNNPSSPIALFALQNAASGEIDVARTSPLFDKLPAPTRNSEEGRAFKKKLDAASLTGIGQPAPAFTQNDTVGLPVSLVSFRGSYVLIDFWASWCGPCRLENPSVVAAYNKYKGKGFKIIGVSLDQPGAKDKWLAAIHKDGLNWTQVSDLKFWNNAVAQTYGVGAIPQNFLIDPNGKIIARSLRGEVLESKLAEVYKQ